MSRGATAEGAPGLFFGLGFRLGPQSSCAVKVGAVHFPKNLDVLNLEGRLLLVGTGGGVKTEIDSLGKVSVRPWRCTVVSPRSVHP